MTDAEYRIVRAAVVGCRGNFLLSWEERAIREKERGDRLAARLRELGVDPDNFDG